MHRTDQGMAGGGGAVYRGSIIDALPGGYARGFESTWCCFRWCLHQMISDVTISKPKQSLLSNCVSKCYSIVIMAGCEISSIWQVHFCSSSPCHKPWRCQFMISIAWQAITDVTFITFLDVHCVWGWLQKEFMKECGLWFVCVQCKIEEGLLAVLIVVGEGGFWNMFPCKDIEWWQDKRAALRYCLD